MLSLIFIIALKLISHPLSALQVLMYQVSGPRVDHHIGIGIHRGYVASITNDVAVNYLFGLLWGCNVVTVY